MNQESQSNISIDFGIKKLKLASKLAFSQTRKENVIYDAENLLGSVDSKIKSIALSKFVFRKAKKLKSLGEKREKINEIIEELEQSNDTIVDKAKKHIVGFGVDKKFLDMNPKEILDMISNIESKKSKSKSERESIPEAVSAAIGTSVQMNTGDKGSTKKIIKSSSDAISKKLKVEKTDQIEQNAITNEINRALSSISGKGQTDSSKKYKNESSEPLELKFNPDTDNIEDVEQNNEKIYDYLVKKGELDIADYILDLMTEPKESEDLKTSEIEKNTSEIKRLSLVNEKIYEKLDELAENMIDEQDTSITSVLAKKSEENVLGSNKIEKDQKVQKAQKEIGIFNTLKKILPFTNILKYLAGGTLLTYLLTKSKDIYAFIKGLLEKGSKQIREFVSKVLKESFDKLFNTKFGKAFKEAFAKAFDASSKVLKSTVEMLEKGLTKVIEILRKIPGVDSIIDFFKRDEGPKKVPKQEPKVPNKLTASKGASILGKLTKFAKPIPIIGTAITAGAAIYSAVDGYENAGELLNKKDSELTESDKLISAAAYVVDDFTFGIISKENAAEKIMKWMSSEDTGVHYSGSLNDGSSERKSSTESKYHEIKGKKEVKISKIITETADRYDLDENLLKSQIRAESGFNVHAVSSKGAMGLMQLMPDTAKWLGVKNPWDPVQNVDGGARFMAWLLNKYKGDIPKALAAYNWGPGNVDKKGMEQLPTETKSYISSILKYIKGDDPENEFYTKKSNETVKTDTIYAPIEKESPNKENKNEYEPKKVSYTMKHGMFQKKKVKDSSGKGKLVDVRGTVNPDDYKIRELFSLNKVKESDFDGLNPVLLSNLKSMAAEYIDLYGTKIQINSAYRSMAEQAELKAKKGNLAATPGKSMHNYGLAIDMNSTNSENAEKSGLFKKYYFTRPVPGELWHIEPFGVNRKEIINDSSKNIKEAPKEKISSVDEAKNKLGNVKDPKAVVPTKAENEIPDVISNEELKAKQNEEKIKGLELAIENLKSEYRKAEKQKDIAKMENIQKFINQKESEISKLKNENKKPEKATKKTISKDKKNKNLENTYDRTLSNTKKYDKSSGTVNSSNQNTNVNINSIAGAKPDNVSPLSVFNDFS